MGLTNKKEEQLRRMPIIQSRVSRSKNGRYIIQRTIITHIKPVEYYQAVLSTKPREASPEDLDAELEEYLRQEGESLIA